MSYSKIRPRGDLKANWESANPILSAREIGVEWETKIGVGDAKIKFGDGVTAWKNLDYAVVNNITKKIITTFATVSDADPALNAGESLDTILGKIKKKFQYLADNKLNKSAKYDGVDSTSTDLYATANAVRKVNVKADKNASDITTLNNNLSNLFTLNGYPYDSILYVDSTVRGFYSCDMDLKDLPVSRYGMALVCQNASGKWIFIIFIPTSVDALYLNFYNGYGDSSGWSGWYNVPLTKK